MMNPLSTKNTSTPKNPARPKNAAIAAYEPPISASTTTSMCSSRTQHAANARMPVSARRTGIERLPSPPPTPKAGVDGGVSCRWLVPIMASLPARRASSREETRSKRLLVGPQKCGRRFAGGVRDVVVPQTTLTWPQPMNLAAAPRQDLTCRLQDRDPDSNSNVHRATSEPAADSPDLF